MYDLGKSLDAWRDGENDQRRNSAHLLPGYRKPVAYSISHCPSWLIYDHGGVEFSHTSPVQSDLISLVLRGWRTQSPLRVFAYT